MNNSDQDPICRTALWLRWSVIITHCDSGAILELVSWTIRAYNCPGLANWGCELVSRNGLLACLLISSSRIPARLCHFWLHAGVIAIVLPLCADWQSAELALVNTHKLNKHLNIRTKNISLLCQQWNGKRKEFKINLKNCFVDGSWPVFDVANDGKRRFWLNSLSLSLCCSERLLRQPVLRVWGGCEEIA